jgi:RHS repeat-associated protein
VFEYDSLGRLVRQKLPEKLGTLYSNGTYLGYSGLWSDVFSYDVRSNLTSHIDARGIMTTFTYHADPLDRLQEVSYDTTHAPADALRVVPVARTTYSYVGVGDVTRVAQETTDGVATEAYEYDIDGRVATKTLVFAERDEYPLALTIAYDSLNRWVMMTYPAFYRYEPGGASQANPNARRRRRLFQSYDVAGRIKQLQARTLTSSSVMPDDYATDLRYNAAGQVTRLVVGASQEGVAETYEYEDSTGFLARQQVARHNTPILALSYRYERPNLSGRTGRLTRVEDGIDPRRTRDYVYDAVGRLVRAATGEPSKTQSTQMYRYDAFGNRTHVEASAVNGASLYDGHSALQFDPSSNRVTTPGYVYDAAGNQTRAQGTGSAWLEYEYDAAGRLVHVVDDARNTLERYGYGADRRRLFTEDGANAVRTYYVWHAGAVIAEYRERPSTPRQLDWWKSNYYLATRLLCTACAESAQKGLEFCHPDTVSTRLVTRSFDHNIYTQTTLPFGTVSTSESTGVSTQPFATYERSGTGLDYAVNRYYDPLQGRFMQVDPLGVGASQIANPQSLNPYVYVANDPINRTDPTGLMWRPAAGGSETGIMVDGFMGMNYFGERNLASPETYAGIRIFGKQGAVIRTSDMQFASMRQGFFTTEQAIAAFVAGYEFNASTKEFYHVASARAELSRLMKGAVASNDDSLNVAADWLEQALSEWKPSPWDSIGGAFGAAAAATSEASISGLVGPAGLMPAGLTVTGAGGASVAIGATAGLSGAFLVGYGIGSLVNACITNWIGTPGKPLGATVYDWLHRD